MCTALLGTVLGFVSPVTETNRRATTGKLPADGGLRAADEGGHLRLTCTETADDLQLITLAAAKMSHTVGGKGLSAFPPTVLKDSYAFQVSVRAALVLA